MSIPTSFPTSTAPEGLLGRTEPRIWTPPLRELTRETTAGYDLAEFADAIGEPFLPWQRWLGIHAMELMPDGTFRFRTVLVLVARQNGKSTFKRTVSLWRLHVDGARTILGVAQDVALAREQMNLCVATIMATPDLREDWGRQSRVNGNEFFRLADDELPVDAPDEAYPRYVIRAANRRAGRGLSIDELNVDELREQQKWDAWAAVSKTVMARRYAQIWAMSNAGDNTSVVLAQLRAAAMSGRDPRIGIFEWSGEDECELDSWPDLAQANPSLGYTVSADAIASAVMNDPPEIVRTEVLCQSVDSLHNVVDREAWKATKDARGRLSHSPKDRLAVCFDVSSSGHCTLAGAAELPDGRVRTAIVRAWRTTDAAWDRETGLAAALDEAGAASIGWYPSGPAAEFRTVFEGRDNVTGLTGAQQNAACQGLVGLVKARQIVHPGDALQTAHVLAVRRLKVGDSWRFVRPDPVRGRTPSGQEPAAADEIPTAAADAAYATAGAVHLALTVPEPVVPNIRVM